LNALSNPAECNSICIVRLSALGDVIMCSALIPILQKNFSNAKIFWITSKAVYPILKNIPGVEFIVIDKPKSFSDWLALRKKLKDYRFDITLCCQANLRVNSIYPLIKSPLKIGFDKKRGHGLHSFFVNKTIPYRDEHLQDGFLNFAETLCSKKQDFIAWPITIDQKNKDRADECLQKLPKTDFIIAINPMASKEERNWSVDRYCQTMVQLNKEINIAFVLIGGPGKTEVETSKLIEQKSQSTKVLCLTGETSITELLAILEKVDLLIAPDTGPVHMARCVNTPVVGLYAVARPELSGPYRALEHCVDKYPEAVKNLLNKNYVSWHTRVHSDKAMDLIKPAEVVASALNILTKRS